MQKHQLFYQIFNAIVPVEYEKLIKYNLPKACIVFLCASTGLDLLTLQKVHFYETITQKLVCPN